MKKIIIILILSLATQVIFVRKGAEFGGATFELDQKIQLLKKQNRNLELQISSLTSCLKIARIAKIDGEGNTGLSVALKR